MKTLLIFTFGFLVWFSSCERKSSQILRPYRASSNSISQNYSRPVRSSRALEKNTVTMLKQNGVYQIPVEINDVPMYFIFDTGASLISISATEAVFLYKQGKLTSADILGKTNFIDSNGDVSEGTIIVLRKVKIGNKILTNVEASVVNNLEAPLLFGQSALERFGKISIDYARNEITLN